jgi:hypothetical protein
MFSNGGAVANTYEKERQLQDEIGSRVEHDLPGVEVLAVELANPDRFVVYVDHPDGVDHALCARVTDVLRDYLREYTVDVSSPGVERPLRRRSATASRCAQASRSTAGRSSRGTCRRHATTRSRSASTARQSRFRTRRSCGAT